jgi:hypothetical protein
LVVRFDEPYVDGIHAYGTLYEAELDLVNDAWKPKGAADGTAFQVPSGASGYAQPPVCWLVEKQVLDDASEIISRRGPLRIYQTSVGEWAYATPAPGSVIVSSPDVPSPTAVLQSEKGVANGVATLDGVGVLQASQVPEIDASGLADGSVTESKVASGAVTEAKLAADAVTQAKIAAGAVDSIELADASVTQAKLANRLYVGYVDGSAESVIQGVDTTGWTVAYSGGTSRFTITHNLGTGAYTVVASGVPNGIDASAFTLGTDTFQVETRDGGTPGQHDFMFILVMH